MPHDDLSSGFKAPFGFAGLSCCSIRIHGPWSDLFSDGSNQFSRWSTGQDCGRTPAAKQFFQAPRSFKAHEYFFETSGRSSARQLFRHEHVVQLCAIWAILHAHPNISAFVTVTDPSSERWFRTFSKALRWKCNGFWMHTFKPPFGTRYNFTTR